VDPTEEVARALASVFPCAACQREFPAEGLRDFEGVPVCVDCYREFGLLTLHTLESNLDPALLGALLSAKTEEVPAGPRRRFEAVERFASRMEPSEAEKLVVTTARGLVGAGIQEILWVLIGSDALLRSGGLNGARPLEGRELSLLLNLSARVGMDVGWAAMFEAGIAARTVREGGEEWSYQEHLGPGGVDPVKLAAEKAAFAQYIRGVKAKVDLLVRDMKGRNDAIDIPLGILARTADEILASIFMMEREGGAASPSRGPSEPDSPDGSAS
jgi:hypothetical protein